MSLAIPKPTIVERVIDRALAYFKPIDDAPVVIREDATTAHGFTYSGGGKIVVRVNPARQKLLDDKGRALKAARDERVNNAGSVREASLKAAKATYDMRVAEIEREHREIAATATVEFERAEQLLLCEFAAPPVTDIPPAAVGAVT